MLISVIVPVYNVDRYLDRCITSIVIQEYEKLEIILVDDGSFDKSPDICDQWANKDSRIIVIHKNNGGLSDARNAGLEKAQGEFVSYVDGDDAIDRTFFSVLMKSVDENNADMAMCGKAKVYNTGRVVYTQCMNTACVLTPRETILEIFRGKSIDESCCDKLFKKKLFEGIRFPVNEINEDLPIIPKVVSRCKTIVHVGKGLYYYHQNNGSITRSGYGEYHIVIKHIDMVRKMLDDFLPELNQNIWILQTRYAIAMLIRLSLDAKAKARFIDDYRLYYALLRQNYKKYIHANECVVSERIVIYSLLIGAYRLLSYTNNLRLKIYKLLYMVKSV